MICPCPPLPMLAQDDDLSFFPGSDMLLQSIMSMFSRVGKMGVIITPSRKIKIKIGKRKTNRTN